MIDGERTTGQDVRSANVTATMAIANIVSSRPSCRQHSYDRARHRRRRRAGRHRCVPLIIWYSSANACWSARTELGRDPAAAFS